MVACVERGFGVHRLMRALECADPEMHNACRDGAAVIARPRDVGGQAPKRRGGEPVHLPSTTLGSHNVSAGM